MVPGGSVIVSGGGREGEMEDRGRGEEGERERREGEERGRGEGERERREMRVCRVPKQGTSSALESTKSKRKRKPRLGKIRYY